MSEKARKFIREAIKIHQKEDGASLLGSYRDVITEVMHLAYENPKVLRHLKGKKDYNTRCNLTIHILNEGNNMFEEEITNNEIARINRIPFKKLPLFLCHKWETRGGEDYYLQRIKFAIAGRTGVCDG